ncbi:MAG: hypothetical protein IJ091_00295 [Oscillospiraceae bacterium]|nr:hypothetical protein [Oscillospiraceae bacterium]
MADKKFNALEALKNKLTQSKTEATATAKPAATTAAKPAATPVAKPAAAPAATPTAKPAATPVTQGRPIATARPTTTTPATPKKSVEELAKEVIRGDWGNGQERKDKLAAAGYNYDEVQDKVNAILYGSSTTTATPLSATKKSVEEIAKEVIRGNWGNGQERKDKLAAAGYNYDEVQAKVNELLK